MEKEEETTRELLLPNWQGSGSHGLTIAQRDDGVFVQEVTQNSPAARTGVVKEGESPQGVDWVLEVGGSVGVLEGRAGSRQKWVSGYRGPIPSGIRVVGTQALPSLGHSVSVTCGPQGRQLCGVVDTWSSDLTPPPTSSADLGK